jgi:Mg2+ and Co2+ transporter CorA
MKKIFCTFIAAALLAGMSTMAFAASETENGKLDNRISTLEERQQRIEDAQANKDEKLDKLAQVKDQVSEFRQALLEKKTTILNSSKTNLEVVSENNQLRLELLKTLDAMKADGGALTEDEKAQLKDYHSQLRTLVSDLEGTKGQIKDVMERYKGFRKDQDYEAMNAAFGEIAQTQAQRADLISRVNKILEDMNALLARQ